MIEKQSDASSLKGKTGMRRIMNAAGYSRDGLVGAFRHEAAFRQLVVLNVVLLAVVWLPDFDTPTRMILIMMSFVSLIVELFNTGIEAAIDRISLEYHPLAKRAKDVGSAAQMLAMTAQIVLWVLALMD